MRDTRRSVLVAFFGIGLLAVGMRPAYAEMPSPSPSSTPFPTVAPNPPPAAIPLPAPEGTKTFGPNDCFWTNSEPAGTWSGQGASTISQANCPNGIGASDNTCPLAFTLGPPITVAEEILGDCWGDGKNDFNTPGNVDCTCVSTCKKSLAISYSGQGAPNNGGTLPPAYCQVAGDLANLAKSDQFDEFLPDTGAGLINLGTITIAKVQGPDGQGYFPTHAAAKAQCQQTFSPAQATQACQNLPANQNLPTLIYSQCIVWLGGACNPLNPPNP